MDTFPPNSQKGRVRAEPKQLQQVATGASRRRRPLGKQFRSVFFGGDARTATEYMVFDVAIPMVKDMLVEAVSSGFERLVLGDRAPRRRGFGQPPYFGHTNYGAVSRGPVRDEPRPGMGRPPMMSRQARARHDFGEIVLRSRQDAEEVLDRMYDALSKYDEVSVADLYALTGIESSHVDTKWGWTDLRGADVGRTRTGGYILQLPDPEIL